MTSTEEIWRPVADWEGLYEVSNLGRVRSLDRLASNGRRYRGKLLTSVLDSSGYLIVRLSEGGKCKNGYIQRMVLRAFVGEPPEGMECAHLDGTRTNNRINNLAWVSIKENASHRKLHGSENTAVGEACRHAKLTVGDVSRIREAALFGACRADLAAMYSVSCQTISDISTRKSWAHCVRENSNVVSKVVL
jgi:hypothetical protein